MTKIVNVIKKVHGYKVKYVKLGEDLFDVCIEDANGANGFKGNTLGLLMSLSKTYGADIAYELLQCIK